MDRGTLYGWMIGLFVGDLMFLLALIRGARVVSDLRAVLLFLLRLVK